MTSTRFTLKQFIFHANLVYCSVELLISEISICGAALSALSSSSSLSSTTVGKAFALAYINYKACGWKTKQGAEASAKKRVRNTQESFVALHVTATHISRSSNIARKYLNQKQEEHDCKHETAQKSEHRRHRTTMLLNDSIKNFCVGVHF